MNPNFSDGLLVFQVLNRNDLRRSPLLLIFRSIAMPTSEEYRHSWLLPSWTIHKLIEKYGRKGNMMKWREMLNAKRDASQLHDRCDLICPDLPKVL